MTRFGSIGSRVEIATLIAASTTVSKNASTRPGTMPIIST